MKQHADTLKKTRTPKACLLKNILSVLPSRIPLRVKITLPYLFLAILLAISASFLFSNIIFHTVEERFYNQLGEVGILSSEFLITEENKLLDTLRLLTHTKKVADLIHQNNPEELRNLIFGIAVNQQVDSVEFLNLDGYPVLSMRHRRGSTIEDYQTTTGGDNTVFKSWDFVNNVLNQTTDHLGDKYSGIAETDGGNFFFVSGPVYNESKQLVGVIVVGTRLDDLVGRMYTGVLAQISLYTKDGKVLASSFPFQPDPLQAELAQKTLAFQNDRKSPLRNIENKRGFFISNLAYYEILGPWEARGGSDLGIIGAALQTSFMVKQSPATRFQLSIVIAAAFFLVIMIGLSLAQTITRPLENLVLASQKIASGSLDVQVDVGTRDEIASLAGSFNQMITSLKQSRADIIEAYDRSLEGWAKALELRDKETEGHTQRVADLTVALAERLGIDGTDLDNIRRGAILHDLGKMAIPDNILLKPGPLTEDEWEIMKQHPDYAYEMLKDIHFLETSLEIPLYHHEHWNGTGYPRGLSEEKIPLSARIFAVIDSWDALTNDRPYRKKISPEDALKILEDNASIVYDPNVVSTFKEYVKTSKMILSDETGK